jgi:hypothetical protein
MRPCFRLCVDRAIKKGGYLMILLLIDPKGGLR